MATDAEKYKLTEAEHQAIFDRRIKPDLFAGAKPSEQPVAIIFGGQPGAGKSAAVDDAVRSLAGRGGAVQVIGDDLRSFHPRYAELMGADDKTAAFYTDKDSGRWVEKSIAHARESRVNLIIEGTMRDGNKVAETMQSLRQAGYVIDARGLAVNEHVSWQGVMERYESQKADRGSGRMTTPKAHADAYNGMPETLERIERDKLADRVSLYRRGGQEIYSNELRDGQWVQEPAAKQTLQAERERPLTLQERAERVAGFDRIREAMDRPSRGATASELRQVDELRLQARRDLAAQVFREVPAKEAIKDYPELAGAYGVMSAIVKKAEADGLQESQRTVFEGRVRENIAKTIERGGNPEIQVKAEQEQQRPRDLEG
jgi:predicted ABC-type ATPase